MEKILKLYTYVSSTESTPFPNDDEQIIIGDFTYTAPRMGIPDISADVKHRLCLDDYWTDEVYAEFNGEKYFIKNTPSSSKDNSDTRYSHNLGLLSEREVLNHVYFIDAVQDDSSVDQHKSNSTKVQFFGDLEQFVERLNSSLSYSGLDYSAVIDNEISTEEKNVSFEDMYVMQAIQQAFSVFGIPYYFVGKVIHFGYTTNTITTVLKYGSTDAFLSISKENANYQVINRITGTGSSDNIPYYYPNKSPKGNVKIKIISGGITEENIKIVDYEKFTSNMSTTDICSLKWGRDIDSGEVGWVCHIGDKKYTLNDLGLDIDGVFLINDIKFGQEIVSYITPSQNLMPPIYRESGGTHRFYNAQNGTYSDGSGGYYEFENEYSTNNPMEGITSFDDIKPTIVGITNENGQRIDSFIEFAYDQNDNDEIDPDTNEYLHPYFFAKLRKTDGEYGFNLFDQAIEQQTMQISFTSGVCGACTFEIGVGEETQKNIVQVDSDGNLKRDENGDVLWENQSPQDRQNDTRSNEVWIALKKDESTYPQVMPNANYNYKPSTSDTFVILGISLPEAYILKAEQDLEDALIKYMWENNTEKFTFSCKFSRIFFEENPIALSELNENSRVVIDYNDKQYTLYIDSYTYKMESSSPLPEIETSLAQTLSYSQNSLQEIIDGVKDDVLSGFKNDFLAQGLRYFIRKDKPDSTKYILRLLGGVEVGEAMDSMTAGRGIVADGNGRMQLDRLEVRNSMKVMEVIFNRLSAMESDYSLSESGAIEAVTPESDGTYTLKLRQEWEGDFTALRENDVIYGMVNDLSSGGSAYYTSWMRVLHADTAGNTLSVNLYPDGEVPGGKNYPPVELMIVTHRGNPVDEDRQSYWYISSSEKRIVMLDGVTKPILEEDNYSVIVGKLPNLDIFTNIPDAYKYSTIYVRAIYAEMIRQIRFPEKLPRVENNRGQWSLSTAQGSDPYMSSVRTDTGAMMADLYDTVYHYGCKWACISDRTEDEPKYGCTGWAMVEGNPEFAVTLQSSEGWGGFDAATFETTLTVRGVLYNQDVTSGILDSDVSWSRDTGDVAEDNAWTAAHAGYGKTLHLTRNDLGPSYHSLTGCMFTVTALLRDGGGDLASQDYFVVGD